MITATDSPETLRNKIKESLDIMDTGELKKLYQVIAEMAAEKATKFADMDWIEKDISSNWINEQINDYRQSKNK